VISKSLRWAAILALACTIMSCVPAVPATQVPLPASPSPTNTGVLAAPTASPSPTDVGDPAPAAGVIFSQPSNSSGKLFQSSLRDPDGSAIDQWAWDDFTLGQTQAVAQVQWRGGYDPARHGSGGPVFDFTLAIYPSNATGFEPDVAHPPLVHYQLGSNAGERPSDVLDGVQTYDYYFELPVPFQATAGTKYWMQIEAFQHGVPDWGLTAGMGGNGHYFRKLADEGIYQFVTGDATFTLLAPGS
jgi:hypothetical protein